MTGIQCRICKSDATYQIASENGYSIFRCRFCNAIYADPVPDAKTLGDYYHELFSKIGPHDYGRFSAEANHAALDWISGNLSPSKALDVGCGYGDFLNGLTALGWECAGLDVEPVAESGTGIKFCRGSIENPPEMDSPYSLITLWWVLEHSTNPEQVLKNVYSMLKPSGIALVRVPNADFILKAGRFRFLEKLDRHGLRCPVSEKRSVFDLLGPPHHLFGFSIKSLDVLRKAAGFSEMKLLFLGRVLTGNAMRDKMDKALYLLAKALFPLTGRILYHDLVVMLRK